MTFTINEIKEIRDKLKALEQKENDAVQALQQIEKNKVELWWDGIKPDTPLTRDEALTAYRFIEGMIKSETDKNKLSLLRQKLIQANEKFKERKRNGT